MSEQEFVDRRSTSQPSLDQRQLSQLYVIADALASQPNDSEAILNFAEWSATDGAFAQSIRALRSEVNAARNEASTVEAGSALDGSEEGVMAAVERMKKVAMRLLRSDKTSPAHEAGRALLWALGRSTKQPCSTTSIQGGVYG